MNRAHRAVKRQIYSLDRLLNGITTPKLVAGPRIELGTSAYETDVLPLHYPAISLIILSRSLQSTTSFVPLHMLVSTCPPAHVATMSTCWSSHSTVFLLDPSHLSQWQQLDVLLLMSCVVLWLLSCIFPPGSRYSWYFPTRLLGISRDSTWVHSCFITVQDVCC